MGGFPAIRVFRTGNPDLTNQVRAGILETDSGRCFARQFSSVWFARKGFPLTARVVAGRSTRCWSKNKYANDRCNPRYHMDADLYDTSFVHTTSLLSSRSEPNRLFTKQRPCPRMSGDLFYSTRFATFCQLPPLKFFLILFLPFGSSARCAAAARKKKYVCLTAAPRTNCKESHLRRRERQPSA